MPPKKTPAKTLLSEALDQAELQIQEDNNENNMTAEDQVQSADTRPSRIPVLKTGTKHKSKSTSSTSQVKRARNSASSESGDTSSSESEADYDLGSDSFFESEEFKQLEVSDRATLRKIKGYFESRVVAIFKSVESYGGFKLNELYWAFYKKYP